MDKKRRALIYRPLAAMGDELINQKTSKSIVFGINCCWFVYDQKNEVEKQ